MVQGTTSDAGKSIVVAGLCRLLARQGISVAPFKPQNMALNSAVTAAGCEIGRAQAMQAAAAGILPHVDMNPILLKPSSDTGSQVIVQGHAVGNMQAVEYPQYKNIAKKAVLESYNRLAAQYDVILVEGAGSPAEINLRDNDIANMGFAEAIDCPVLLVSDIDRGGVFAHLVGTLALLTESERERVSGFLINRFRGDVALLQPGVDWLTQYTRKPTWGVLPFLPSLYIEAEDSLNVLQNNTPESALLNVVIPRLPKLSNHTDFDPLALHPSVSVTYINAGEKIPSADLIILPGSKSVISDLNWLRENGWQVAIERHCRYGGKLLGVCGGYQMLGHTIADPDGIEGSPGESAQGFGLLDIETQLQSEKMLKQVRGYILPEQVVIAGYEIHAGVTRGPGLLNPMLQLDYGVEGVKSADGLVMGTYLHGLFDEPAACQWLLGWASSVSVAPFDIQQRRNADLDRLADALEQSIGVEYLAPLLKV